MLIQQIERLRGLWEKLSPNQRMATVGTVLAIALAIGILIFSRPPERFEPAFSGLSSDDAAAIADQLRGQGIPYRIGGDGTTILVPSEHVPEVRLNAASEGLPKGSGIGFELFDQSSFGLTDFAQRVNYQRALEGELQRTIDQIEAVAASRLHIVVPEESLFTEDQQPTTASVVLKLKPGQRLTERQVKGVSHLVSASVPGLNPENLTIVDTTGNTIWAGSEGDSEWAGTDDRFEFQQAYEANMATQLQALVERIVGPGHAAVRVNATLGWDERTVDSEIYSPDGTEGQIRSQQERTELSNGNIIGAAGLPGVDANLQTFQEGVEGENQITNEVHDITTNYELSRRVEHLTEAPGQLQRLSVAVVLNGDQVDPLVAQEIQNLVAAAAGIVQERGDAITVSAVPFNDIAEIDGLDGLDRQQQWERILEIAKIAGLVLVPIIMLLVARRLVLRQRDLTPVLPAPVRPRPRVETQRLIVEEAPAPPVEPVKPRVQSHSHEQIVALAKEDPAQIAQLIRLWMSEER